MTLKRLLTFVVAMTLALLPLRMEAQAPSGDQIRARIRASGMSEEQIRQRLQSAGYSANMLDAYLSDNQGPAPAPSQDILAALSALSADSVAASGLSRVMVDTAAQVAPRARDDGRVGSDSSRIFGLDVFRGRSTQFQPLLAGPVPESYRLGAGDLLVLVLSGDVELVHNLEVTRDGFVLIPQVGQLYVGSLTMAQVKTMFRQRLGNSYSGIRSGSTQFDVTLARLRTNQVYVIGEVVQPGAYQLASVATVLNALYAAGGPTERGGMRAVRVERQGKTVATFDLYEYLLRGNTASDVTLEMGDVVFVPVHGVRATVSGAVLRPAAYELAAGQTLRDLVDAAGGFTPEAALRRISISRIVPPAQRGTGGPERIVLDVPVDQVMNGQAPAVTIEAGDEVQVFEVPRARRALVELKGAVYHPGTYGWRPGLKISDVVRMAGGVTPAVFADFAHVERLNVADSTRYLVRVPVPADSTQPWTNDIAVEEFDIITVYGREDLREEREVQVSGMVGNPGRFAYSEGMTVRDLILQAGGLRDGAYLDSVEIARLPVDRTQGQLARTFRMPLDSTYLTEPNGTSYRYLPGPPGRANGTAEIPLEPFDKVTILRQPDFELQRTVEIRGEVGFPATYALRTRTDRLSDLIARAGGVKPTAYLAGAKLVRTEENAGTVDVDLTAALRNPNGSEDIVLRPGDIVTVPEYNAVVRVTGAVVAPVSVQFREGEPLSYYIANAGGYTRAADKGRVSVRYANGSADITRRQLLFFRSNPDVGPGAVITVPERSTEDRLDVTAFMTSMAQIVASTATIIVILTR